MRESEQQEIKRYLLGETDDAGRETFEKKVLADPDYLDAVSMSEDELIEDFVAGALSEGERKRFVEHFLSTPQQRQRLEEIQALHSHLTGKPVPETLPDVGADARPALAGPAHVKPPRGRFSFAPLSAAGTVTAFLVLLALIIGVWLWMGRADEKWSTAFGEAFARLNDPRNTDSLPPPGQDIRLSPTLTRSVGEMAKVNAPAGAEFVRVELSLPPERFQSYRATLLEIDGGESFTPPPLKPRTEDGSRALILNLPVRTLPRGDYELRLSGIRDDDTPAEPRSYFFRLIR